MISAVGVIPARYGSSRLPGKPLAELQGRPLLYHVYNRASRARSLQQVLIATDDARIVVAARKFGADVRMTGEHHRSGTDRIAEVAAGLNADVVVNIQGDEPMITPGHLELLLGPLRSSEPDPQTQVSTLKVAVGSDDARNSNNVKVVTDFGGRALYFFRAPIPHDRDGSGRALYYKHLGL